MVAEAKVEEQQWPRTRAAGLSVIVHTPSGGGASRGLVCADELEAYFAALNVSLECMVENAQEQVAP